MNYRDINISIGDVAAALPKASLIFKEYGIDFCCGGHRPLAAVMKEQSLPLEEVYGRLDQLVTEHENNTETTALSFDQMSSPVLSAYIEDTHHSYLRKALPEAAELLNTVLRVHGSKHRELFEMYQLFGRLKTDLEQHLLKEENLLFPLLENSAAACSCSKDTDSTSEARSLTDEIISEHEAAGEILRKLRSISKDYTLPDGACATYQKTYSLLEALEQDLHQHIHLENNILLKDYATH